MVFSVASASARNKKSEPSDEIVIEDENDAEHPKTTQRQPAQTSNGRVYKIESSLPVRPEFYEIQTDHASCVATYSTSGNAISCVPK